jgi:hypothetical protein
VLPDILARCRRDRFSSLATNLVTGDTNGRNDAFVRTRSTNSTERVSRGIGGAESNGHTENPKLSADGRYVMFVSAASNLVPDDTNGVPDAFVFDRMTQTTTRVSVGDAGQQGNGRVHYASFAGNGRAVVFSSEASNLVIGDTNGVQDIFVHYLPPTIAKRRHHRRDDQERLDNFVLSPHPMTTVQNRELDDLSSHVRAIAIVGLGKQLGKSRCESRLIHAHPHGGVARLQHGRLLVERLRDFAQHVLLVGVTNSWRCQRAQRVCQQLRASRAGGKLVQTDPALPLHRVEARHIGSRGSSWDFPGHVRTLVGRSARSDRRWCYFDSRLRRSARRPSRTRRSPRRAT